MIENSLKNSPENIKNEIWIESKILLKNLKNEISKNFWIKNDLLENLILNKSINSLEKLKLELQNKNNFLEKEKIKELFLKINEAKILFEEISKNQRENLKNEIEEEININNFSNNLEKFLPRKLVKTAKNPEKPHEHLIWASLWIANSAIAIWEGILKVWIWIIKSPYDLYLLAFWKAEIENIKKI